jgi:hypothetical protein
MGTVHYRILATIASSSESESSTKTPPERRKVQAKLNTMAPALVGKNQVKNIFRIGGKKI